MLLHALFCMPYSAGDAKDSQKIMTNTVLYRTVPVRYCSEHVLLQGTHAAKYSVRHHGVAIMLKNKTSGGSPRNDMEQSSSFIAAGAQQCVEVVDVHSAARNDESGTGGVSGRATRSLKFVLWTSFSRKRLDPLLRVSRESSRMAQFTGRSCDESPIARKLKHGRKPKQHLRNSYQRSYVAVFITLGVVAVMSVYQDVVLGVGIAGCGPEALFQETCEGTMKSFVTRPLVFRQVGCPPTPSLVYNELLEVPDGGQHPYRWGNVKSGCLTHLCMMHMNILYSATGARLCSIFVLSLCGGLCNPAVQANCV